MLNLKIILNICLSLIYNSFILWHCVLDVGKQMCLQNNSKLFQKALLALLVCNALV